MATFYPRVRSVLTLLAAAIELPVRPPATPPFLPRHATGTSESVLPGAKAALDAARRKRTGPKGLVVEVVSGVTHRASGGVLTHRSFVTILRVGDVRVPARLQEQTPSEQAPAVVLVRARGRWIARPAAPPKCGTYTHARAFISGDALAELVGDDSAVPLADVSAPCDACRREAYAGYQPSRLYRPIRHEGDATR